VDDTGPAAFRELAEAAGTDASPSDTAGATGTTDSVPHALDSHIRTSHAVARIRPSLFLAPDTVRPGPPGQASGSSAEAVPAGAARPKPDGAARHGTIAPVDGQGRVHLRKALASMGWSESTGLVAEVSPQRAVVRAGAVARPTDIPLALDKQGRLSLSPTVVAALSLREADQVLAIAVPATGELHVCAAASVLQDITGTVEPEPATHQVARDPRPRGIRPRFAPALAAVPAASAAPAATSPTKEN
jgi:hypothetical protein